MRLNYITCLSEVSICVKIFMHEASELSVVQDVINTEDCKTCMFKLF